MLTIDLIALWPSRTAFAADLGVKYGRVQQWIRRNSIPDYFWNRVVWAAHRRGIDGITLQLLADIAERTGIPPAQGGAL